MVVNLCSGYSKPDCVTNSPDFVEVIQTLGLVFTTGVSLFCTFKLQTLQAEWQKPPSQWLKEARQTLLMPLKTMPSSCTAEKCSLSLSLREQSWSEPHWLPLAVALHSLCHSWPDAASIKRGFLEVFVGFLRGQSRKSSPYPLTPSFHRLWEEQFTQVELRWSETKDAIPWEKPGCELGQHSCCLSREKRGLESHSDPGSGSCTLGVKSLPENAKLQLSDPKTQPGWRHYSKMYFVLHLLVNYFF